MADDINYINDTPRIPGTSRLAEREFLRLFPEESPLIAIAADSGAVRFTFDIISPPRFENKELQIRWTTDGGTSRSVLVRRASSAESTGKPLDFDDAEPFWSNDRYTSSDYDVQRMIGAFPSDAATIVVLFYVLSYGVDGTFAPLYSEPTEVYQEVELQL